MLFPPRSDCKPDAKRKRDSAQPQERALPSRNVHQNHSQTNVCILNDRRHGGQADPSKWPNSSLPLCRKSNICSPHWIENAFKVAVQNTKTQRHNSCFFDKIFGTLTRRFAAPSPGGRGTVCRRVLLPLGEGSPRCAFVSLCSLFM